MSRSLALLDPRELDTLQYIVTHVYCPLQLPDGDDHTIRNDRSLAGAVSAALRLYDNHVDQANLAQWHSVTQMLDNLQTIVQFETLDRFQTFSQLSSMNVGGKRSSLHGILRLTTGRCPRISYSSPKCGGRVQKAEICHHFRVVRGIPEGRGCDDYTRKAHLFISWAGDRDSQRRV